MDSPPAEHARSRPFWKGEQGIFVDAKNIYWGTIYYIEFYVASHYHRWWATV